MFALGFGLVFELKKGFSANVSFGWFVIWKLRDFDAFVDCVINSPTSFFIYVLVSCWRV